MAIDRISALDTALKAAGIPFAGFNNNGPPYPAGLTIMYRTEATQEQRDQGENLKETFDYRPRRDLTVAQNFAGISGLAAGQQQAFQRRFLAHLVRIHGDAAQEIISSLALPLAVDEVDPTPT